MLGILCGSYPLIGFFESYSVTDLTLKKLLSNQLKPWSFFFEDEIHTKKHTKTHKNTQKNMKKHEKTQKTQKTQKNTKKHKKHEKHKKTQMRKIWKIRIDFFPAGVFKRDQWQFDKKSFWTCTCVLVNDFSGQWSLITASQALFLRPVIDPFLPLTTDFVNAIRLRINIV